MENFVYEKFQKYTDAEKGTSLFPFFIFVKNSESAAVLGEEKIDEEKTGTFSAV